MKQPPVRLGLLLIASLGLLTGCLPTATNPLGSLEKATPEERLVGTWYGKSGEDQVFLHFVQGKGAEMQIVEVDHEKKGEAHTTLYHAFPTTIGENHYLNVHEGKQVRAGPAVEQYYFVRYQLSKSGLLSLSLMTDTSAVKAIANGKIKGKVTGADTAREVKITDSTEHLAAFLGKGDPDLIFDQKFGTFKKVTLPSLEAAELTPSKKPAPSKPAPKAAPRKKKRIS